MLRGDWFVSLANICAGAGHRSHCVNKITITLISKHGGNTFLEQVFFRVSIRISRRCSSPVAALIFACSAGNFGPPFHESGA